MENIILEPTSDMDSPLHKPQHIIISDSSGTDLSLQLNDLIESMNTGILCLNAQAQIVYANSYFCNILGYSYTELVSQNIFDLLYTPQNARLAKAKFELCKRGIADSYDIEAKTKNGEQLWLRLNGKPLTNALGEFAGVVLTGIPITQQRLLEQELIDIKEDLEAKVITRTRQLSETNHQLIQQMKERKLAEISLKNSEKRFRDIYLNSPDAIYIESYDGVILDINEATCRLHHTENAEILIGKSVFDISPTHLHAAIKSRQPKIITGEIKKFESECLTADGNTTPIEVSVARIEYKNQPALLMHVRDITDRKNTEQLLQHLNTELEHKVAERTRELQQQIDAKVSMQKELQQQKDFLRTIIDSDPNLIFVKDETGKFIIANKATAHFYGMKPEDMEGHFDSEDNFSFGDLESFKAQDEQVLKTKKEVQFPEQSVTSKETGKTIWLQTIKKTIPALHSGGVNILGVGTDITAIKQTKEDLRISEQLYREIARNIPNAAMFIFNKELRFILAEGPLVGVVSKSKADIQGRHVFETVRDTEREHAQQVYQSILDGHSSQEEQTLLGRTLRVHHLPICDYKGEVIYGMVMVFDISDLRGSQSELEKRATLLQRSNDELERFAYVASHDLQGPLRTIASYLQLLEMRYKDSLDTEALEFIHFSVGGAKRMQTLILDLLNYSRISSAPKPFVLTNINQVLSEVKRTLDSSITTAHAEVVIQPLPEIMAEPNQLFQLFQNLIDNAIKFVKDKTPLITIACTERPQEWEFSVADNGIGIKSEFREKIFQIFQRLHTTTEYPGTGVGLAICKKIVTLHGGKIWFVSTPDQGTTFYFTIRKGLEND